MKVLLVEDSRVFAAMILRRFDRDLNYMRVRLASNLEETHEILKTNQGDFDIAILDLILPDAPNGEVVDLVLSKGIPTLVLSGEYSDDLQEMVWSKKILDYVIKEGPLSLDYVTNFLKRFRRNLETKVMVVDDSKFSRQHLINLLSVHQFQLFEAQNGQEALEILEVHPDIKLIITDYNMPIINGFELTRQVRKDFGPEAIAIIGISSSESIKLSARFIKTGANDFIQKPFLSEQFYCRINMNLDIIYQVDEIKDASNKDYLTGLYNRRYFFKTTGILLENAERNQSENVLAMIDIDYFKQVNDTHGHDVGDMVLAKVAATIQNYFRKTDLVARFGGEEFAVLATNMSPSMAEEKFNLLLKEIESTSIECGDITCNVTVSIGICTSQELTIEERVAIADEALYQAKRSGRNRVCVLAV